MQKVARKVQKFVLANYILMEHSWKNFLICYSARKSMSNIYVSLRIFKNKPLVGGILLYTVLILAANRTQVPSSNIIPLDRQDFCRYCQYNVCSCQVTYAFQSESSEWGQLQSLKLQISRQLQARSSSTFRQL